MRSTLLAVLVLGFAALGGAQTTPQVPSAAVPMAVKARSVEVANEVYQLRGDVQFKIGNVTITADEADLVDGPTREIALRGNVKMSLPRPQ